CDRCSHRSSDGSCYGCNCGAGDRVRGRFSLMAVAKKRAVKSRVRKSSTALAYPPFTAETLQRFNLGAYPQYLNDYYQYMGYAGNLYPLQQSITGWSKTEEVAGTLPNYMRILMKSPPAFAAQLVRGLVMSQAR